MSTDLRQQLLEQRDEHEIGKYKTVFGVIDDEDELLREQPRIDRVTNENGAADAVVGLEMPVVVPCDGRHPVTALKAERAELIARLETGGEELGNVSEELASLKQIFP